MPNKNADPSQRWVPIPGYKGHYEVSSQGEVRSREREIATENGQLRTYCGKLLKPWLAHGGRYKVYLYKDGQREGFFVDELVLTAFRGVPQSAGVEPIHLNHNSQDNRLSNLRWADSRARLMHRIDAPLELPQHLKSSQVIEIRQRYATDDCTMQDLSLQYGVSVAQISRIVRGKAWPELSGPIKGRDYG